MPSESRQESTQLQKAAPCEHAFQHHPMSDDFGVCSKCGAEEDFDAPSTEGGASRDEQPTGRECPYCGCHFRRLSDERGHNCAAGQRMRDAALTASGGAVSAGDLDRLLRDVDAYFAGAHVNAGVVIGQIRSRIKGLPDA
jgi:DNA-directed RNA polymerase subunit RPC12/RpoP